MSPHRVLGKCRIKEVALWPCRAAGRLAEGDESIIVVRGDEIEKCEFMRANAQVQAWSSDEEEEAGLMVQNGTALRKQAREILAAAQQVCNCCTY